MLWHKEVMNVTVTGGTGAGVTGRLYGRVEHMLITPIDTAGVLVSATSWDCTVIDRDGDQVDTFLTQTGRLDDRTYLPIGQDSSERLRFTFTNVTQTPDRMRVVLKVRDKT